MKSILMHCHSINKKNMEYKNYIERLEEELKVLKERDESGAKALILMHEFYEKRIEELEKKILGGTNVR